MISINFSNIFTIGLIFIIALQVMKLGSKKRGIVGQIGKAADNFLEDVEDDFKNFTASFNGNKGKK